MNKETVFDRAQYPNGKRSVEWFHNHFDLVLAIIKNKGYKEREAVRLAWNIFEDTDWKNYPECLTVEQKAQQMLSKEDYERQCCESMLAAMDEEPDGYGKNHYFVTVDSPDKLAIAKVLIDLGIRPCDINRGCRTLISGVTSFDIYGYYEEEVARILSEKLHCLTFVEDAWDCEGTAVFLDGELAIYGDDYLADIELRSTDTPDCFDTEFSVKRPDGTAFATGGGGSVHLDNLDNYLKPLNFDREAFNKEFGYVTLSAKNRRRAV
jgi:hypothetical protein